jgi:glutathione synthase/RimK-type ligase-like ATP-grasp enzyme
VRLRFAPYALRVSATRHLAEMFDTYCIYPEGSKFKPRRGDVIVNWGRTNLPNMAPALTVNAPENVRIAVNKIDTFRLLTHNDVPTVEWTTDPMEAGTWLMKDGEIVFARHSVTGRGGKGIEVFNHADRMGDKFIHARRAPLYTRYAKRKHEYRVHVFRDRVIDAQQKKRRAGIDRTPESAIIRSYDNGWVFCRGGVTVPDCVKDAAIKAVAALGLDFGGVDVGYNEHYDRAYVFEVNSAPGIEGTTLQSYANAFKELR